jgi:hypothetical protein
VNGTTQAYDTPDWRLGASLSRDDAEAIVEAAAILDCDRLGEAACGDGEVIKEANVNQSK